MNTRLTLEYLHRQKPTIRHPVGYEAARVNWKEANFAAHSLGLEIQNGHRECIHIARSKRPASAEAVEHMLCACLMMDGF